DLVCINGTDSTEESAVVGEGGGHEARRLTKVGRPVSDFEEGAAIPGVSRLPLRGAEPDAQVNPCDGIAIGDLRVQVERLPAVAKRVAGAQRRQLRIRRHPGE